VPLPLIKNSCRIVKIWNSFSKKYLFRKGEYIDVDKIVEELNLPLFVKPNQSGSSLGISKVKKNLN
jgi:D-alanine-D-alanine ligase-like ATP-grasp enzyme